MKPPQDFARTFVFLQGPPGPFFARLADALVAAGHRVHRINFNGGDRRFWPNGATDYRGSLNQWPRFFQNFVDRHQITDVVLFGDCRPLHRSAHILAGINNLRTHVFEEGYIRPDWVTLELDGVNGNSSLPSDPEWFVAEAQGLPPVPEHPPVPSSFDRRYAEAFGYYQSMTLQTWRYPRYRSHRPVPALVEGAGWIKRNLLRARARARSAEAEAQVGRRPYFVFPLQLSSDTQIQIHSPFGDMRVALDFVLASFARAAPEGVDLVAKLHPLDSGLTNWRRVTLKAAQRLGIADRVLFLEEGDIAQLVRDATGVVTVNSTTGTLSAGAGVPTIVLGKAVYNIPGITHQGPLDEFWSDPVPPDPLVWDSFCRVLVDRCLIHGGFLSDEGIELLVAGSVRRLTCSSPFDAVAIEPSPLRF